MKIKNIESKNKYVKIDNILNSLNSNSFFYVFLLSTFITSLPTPAWGFGSSTVPAGLICLFLSIQLFFNYKHIYLPKYLLDIKIKKSIFDKINSYIKNKKTKEYEEFSKIFNKTSAIIIFLNSILMCIPIIFTNWLPSLSTTLISLAHILKNKKMLYLYYVLSIIMLIVYLIIFTLGYKVGKNIIDKLLSSQSISFTRKGDKTI